MNHARCLAMLLFVSLLAPLATVRAEIFIHPAYAYAIKSPEGFAVRAFVDDFGTPYHVLTPDAGDEPFGFARGMWVFAVPIPTDDQLDPNAITPLITGLITAHEPGLKISEKRTPTKLGSLEAVVMTVEGRRKTPGEWKGELIVAVQDDNFIVIHQGGPPAEFDALKGKFNLAISSFTAPLPIRSFSEPPAGTKPLTVDEAKALLKRCTPRVKVLARSDVKDEDTLNIDFASGTGFLIHPDGWVITNRHVVESNSVNKLVRLPYDPVELHFDKSLNIKPQPTDVIAVSSQWDLALLKIRGNQKWPTVPLAEASRIKPGHNLLVAGWPEPAKYGKDNLTISPGKVLSIDTDGRLRHHRLRHDAFTRPGSSGGPVFDLDLGAIVAAHYQAVTYRALVNGVMQDMPGGFKGGVPVSRLLWEFPQIAAHWRDLAGTIEERRALTAYFLLQERFGAAFIEAGKALKEKPEDGMTNAYAYRMYAMQRDTERAQQSLLAARRRPASSYAVVLMAAQTSLENGDILDSFQWVGQAFQMAPTHPMSHLTMLRSQVASGGNAASFIVMTQNAFANSPHPELEFLKGMAAVTNYLKTYRVIRLPVTQPPQGQVLIDATIALERSIELWPARNGLSWANLAILHAVDGRKKKAAECREKALRVSPNDAFNRLAIAHFDLLNGDYKNAREQIGEANSIRGTAYGTFLTGWANMLEAKAIAPTNVQAARQLAAIGQQQILNSRSGNERQSWWASYAAEVSSRILER